MSMSDKDKTPPPDEAETEVDTEANTEAEANVGAGEQTPEDRIAALEAEAADLRDRLLREMAEMENLRKRARREVEDAGRYAVTGFARDLVTVADDLRRALATVPEEASRSGDEAMTALVEGLEVTERSFEQALERHGIKRFEPQGERFDPERHEAMFEVPDETVPANTVAHVVEAGYTIADRVLRPARVGVSKGGPRSAPVVETKGDRKSETSAPAGEPEAEAPQAPEPGADPQRIGIKIDKSA